MICSQELCGCPKSVVLGDWRTRTIGWPRWSAARPLLAHLLVTSAIADIRLCKTNHDWVYTCAIRGPMWERVEKERDENCRLGLRLRLVMRRLLLMNSPRSLWPQAMITRAWSLKVSQCVLTLQRYLQFDEDVRQRIGLLSRCTQLAKGSVSENRNTGFGRRLDMGINFV